MVQWDLPRTPTSVSLLTELAAERGVPNEVSLRGTRLRPGHLRDPNVEVSATQELRVITNILDALGDDSIGLGVEAGVRYHLTAYGIFGFALISSPTLRGAAEVGLRYLDLTFSFTDISLREADGEAQMVFSAPEVPRAAQRFCVERETAAVRQIIDELLATPLPIQRLRYAFPPPPRVDRYADVFGVTPEFGTAETIMGFAPASFEAPLPQANEHTALLAQAQCRELLDRRKARAGLSGQVRNLLLERIAYPPSAEQVAATLHLSSRTLRERLAAEGTSFRGLLDEVRERLAEEMLLRGLAVSQISERLGYVEISSFSQAFRRWKGMGPREYRSRHGAGR
jgi:AraC-like DNA-binding protein